jgi:NodT family efflux transporter outer membrane factor (OMF) lipoprotein
MKKNSLLILLTLSLSACTVGPDYVRPQATIPAHYKEAPKGWKIAQPQDMASRGAWWQIFNNPQLNSLEAQLTISNQTIAIAAAQYQQALALVDEARAAYFPTINSSVALTRQSSSSADSSTSTKASKVSNAYSLLLNATWEPDLWGSVRRNVESTKANAEASAAQLAIVQLAAHAALAQYYFELRAVDKDQQLLNDTVNSYQSALKLTQNRYNAGVAGRADIVQAQTQLATAQAQAINNGINRAQYEHAIAVLIGQAPATFALTFKPLAATPPIIPSQIPSALLERRPDIAQAERQMAAANAQIGVAIAAYFPDLTLSASANFPGSTLAHWISLPALAWAVGPQLAETLFDGGLRSATTKAARANYDASVANYRQTVLAAFQDVEDNLAALRILNAQAVVQNQAATSAQQALKLITNQYKAGIASYSDVIIAQTAAYSAEKSAADVNGLRMTTAVGLVKALGGGWNAGTLNNN